MNPVCLDQQRSHHDTETNTKGKKHNLTQSLCSLQQNQNRRQVTKEYSKQHDVAQHLARRTHYVGVAMTTVNHHDGKDTQKSEHCNHANRYSGWVTKIDRGGYYG